MARDVLPKLAELREGVYTLSYDGGAERAFDVAVCGAGPTRIGRGADARTSVDEAIARLASLGKRVLVVERPLRAPR